MRRALGKGLSQLIADQHAESGPMIVPIADIMPNAQQPRTHFDEGALAELAESIREVGVLQPILVRPVQDGKFEIIAGERRWRASQLAGLERVPIVVRSASERQTLELALVENLQRSDISSIEAAQAYRRLSAEFDLTQEQIAQRVGKSRSAVANSMRLLKLPRRVQDDLIAGNVSEGQVRPLVTLDSEVEQLAVYEQIRKYDLSTRDVEERVKRAEKKPRAKRTVIDAEDPNWRALAQRASEVLGAEVTLTGTERGGAVRIVFYGEDDLMRIMEKLGIEL